MKCDITACNETFSHDHCQCCEKIFDRQELEIVDFNDLSAPNSFLACEPCALFERMKYYRKKFEESRDSIERMKHELNLFRSILLRPDTMAALANDPTTVQPSTYEIRRRTKGLEALNLDQLIFWMETYELYAREISALVNKKASPKELKEHLESKTKVAIQAQVKSNIEAKKKVNDGLVGDYTSMEKKAVLQFMKTLRCDEATASAYVKGVTVKP